MYAGLSTNTLTGQVGVHFVRATTTISKPYGKQVTIPLHLSISGLNGASVPVTIDLEVLGAGWDLPKSDTAPLLPNNGQTFVHKGHPDGSPSTVTVFVMLPATGATDPYWGKELSITASASIANSPVSVLGNHTIAIRAEVPYTPTIDEYFDDCNLALDYVYSVTQKNNELTLFGQDGMRVREQKVRMVNAGDEYTLSASSWILGGLKAHFRTVPFSIAYVPLRIRPRETVTDSEGTLRTYTRRGVSRTTDLGLKIDLAQYGKERYFANGKRSSHRVALGIWGAPGVHEIDSTQIIGESDIGSKPSNQLILSLGLTVTYKYNNVQFMIVPFGYDIGLSEVARDWVYHGRERNWYGIGIAIDPAILGPIFGK